MDGNIPDPHTAATTQDETDRVFREVCERPEGLREIVFLHYYDDVTCDDIADVLGIARSTVNARLAKARKLLACRLSSLARSGDELR